MSILPLIDIDIESPDSLAEFLDVNALAHETIFTAILDSGVVTDHYPLWTNGTIDPDWLQTHAAEHEAWSAVLGLSNVVELDQVDPEDPAQMADWFNDHALHHQRVNEALGLT